MPDRDDRDDKLAISYPSIGVRQAGSSRAAQADVLGGLTITGIVRARTSRPGQPELPATYPKIAAAGVTVQKILVAGATTCARRCTSVPSGLTIKINPQCAREGRILTSQEQRDGHGHH